MSDLAIGLKITRLREARALTTTQLAERAGISQAQISRLENGKQGFRTATLSKIARALNVKPAYFFQEDGEDGVLSPRLSEAVRHPEFAAFAERAAAAYLEQPDILPVLIRALDRPLSSLKTGGPPV